MRSKADIIAASAIGPSEQKLDTRRMLNEWFGGPPEPRNLKDIAGSIRKETFNQAREKIYASNEYRVWKADQEVKAQELIEEGVPENVAHARYPTNDLALYKDILNEAYDPWHSKRWRGWAIENPETPDEHYYQAVRDYVGPTPVNEADALSEWATAARPLPLLGIPFARYRMESPEAKENYDFTMRQMQVDALPWMVPYVGLGTGAAHQVATRPVWQKQHLRDFVENYEKEPGMYEGRESSIYENRVPFEVPHFDRNPLRPAAYNAFDFLGLFPLGIGLGKRALKGISNFLKGRD